MAKITNEIKNNNVKQLEYISKDMANLARRLKSCNVSNPAHDDILGSSIVETSFFVNAYGISAQAFRNMITDLNKEENPGARGDVLFYIFEEARKFEKEVADKKAKIKESDEQ